MLSRPQKAFTLLELIVVIVILGLLAALAIPTFKRVIDRSKESTARASALAVGRNALALALAALESGSGSTDPSSKLTAAASEASGATASGNVVTVGGYDVTLSFSGASVSVLSAVPSGSGAGAGGSGGSSFAGAPFSGLSASVSSSDYHVLSAPLAASATEYVLYIAPAGSTPTDANALKFNGQKYPLPASLFSEAFDPFTENTFSAGQLSGWLYQATSPVLLAKNYTDAGPSSSATSWSTYFAPVVNGVEGAPVLAGTKAITTPVTPAAFKTSATVTKVDSYVAGTASNPCTVDPSAYYHECWEITFPEIPATVDSHYGAGYKLTSASGATEADARAALDQAVADGYSQDIGAEYNRISAGRYGFYHSADKGQYVCAVVTPGRNYAPGFPNPAADVRTNVTCALA